MSLFLKQKRRMKSPVSKRLRHEHISEWGARTDYYHWMRLSDKEKNNPNDSKAQEVVEYLKAENKYTKHFLAPVNELQDTIYSEMIGRLVPNESSVPYFSNGHWFKTEYEANLEYPIYKWSQDPNHFDILMDANIIGNQVPYYQIGHLALSPNKKMLAYSDDRVGRRKYTIRFRSLTNGEELEHIIEDTTGHIVWDESNTYIYYTKKDEALRPYRIMRHKLGANEADIVIYEEHDEKFRTYIYKSKSKRYLLIASVSSLTTEYRFLDANGHNESCTLFAERQTGIEYHPLHIGNQWLIKTNKDESKNFKIMKTDLEDTSVGHWTDYIPYNKDVLIEDIDYTNDYLIIQMREEAETKIKVHGLTSDHQYYVELPESASMVFFGTNMEEDATEFRIRYTSLTTPMSTYDITLADGTKSLLKEQKVLGKFDKADYVSQRFLVTARDGEAIPVSLVHHKDFSDLASRPLLLYAYGSYGHSIDPYFSAARLSLLNRGFSFAIAHIRGGSDKGRQWYEDGKFLKKKNTFNDFIDVGQHLIQHSLVAPQQLYAMGGSAGGLLMGAVMNMQPEMWAGIIAAVPFVDVVSTMLDESIPLTVGEYEEWGNPNQKEYYDYMLSYSPYDNVAELPYPNLLVTSGYHDSQVQYWEPTKWIAKLRHHNTSDNTLLLHTNLDAGHGGASGRYRQYEEIALEYAFLLYLADQKS